MTRAHTASEHGGSREDAQSAKEDAKKYQLVPRARRCGTAQTPPGFSSRLPSRSSHLRDSLPFFGLRRRRLHLRGTAEIELILCCTVLITLLLLVMGAMRIGAARLSVGGSASFEAFHNATADPVPQYTGDTPVDGFASVRPGLPNRVHQPHETAQVSGGDGNKGRFTANVGSTAAVISPVWTFSAYPVGEADQELERQWFESDVDESHNGLTYPLGLAADWTP